jgi:hypothetical protein
LHWADGGETSLENLALLCGRHHALVHEGGFRVERAPDGGLVFRSARGRVIERAPRPPRVADDAGAVIASEHRDAGLRIDAQTATVRYTHRPDYDACVAAATPCRAG